MEIKDELKVKTHAEVAKALIDCFINRNEEVQGPSEPKRKSIETCTIKKLTSTPGPDSHSMLHVLPSDVDVSEITSSDQDAVNISNNEMSGVEEMKDTASVNKPKSTYKMSSSFLNPFDLSIDVTESVMHLDDDDDLSDEDYEPTFNLTIKSMNKDIFIEDDSIEESSDDEEESIKPEMAGPGVVKVGLDSTEDFLNDVPCIVFSSCLDNLSKTNVTSVCNFGECKKSVVMRKEVVGSAVYLKWVCNGGHNIHKWCSQPVLNNRLHGGDMLLAASILFSGNNFKKVSMMAKILNLPFLGESSFNKIQRTYLVPVIDDYWLQHQENVLERFIGKEITILGDGRMDSPGHSAQYCSYTFMEYESKEILTIITMDKRVTERKSTNLEKACFIKGLRFLLEKNLTITEVVTDAHTQIAALMKKDFPNIQHSFDVWHGAKNFGKKICRTASKDKQTADLTEWSKDIVNHLWYCYDICNTKEEFVFVWAGLLNHVVNKHEWLCPQDSSGKIVGCQHGPLETEREKTWLKPNSPAHVALRKLVLDKRFLNQIHHYLTFRSTAELENFQNLILMYASKRIAYRPPTYRARNQLAALDHNSHLNRPSIVNKDGTLRYQRSYNKKSGRWSAYPVKEDKKYQHLKQLMRNVVVKRLNDNIGMNRPAILEPGDPRLISRVLAPVPPPATAEIVQRQKSRFARTNESLDDTIDYEWP